MISKALKSLWTILTTITYTVVLGIPAMVSALVSRTGRLPFRFARPWAWLIMKTHRVILQVEGREKILKHRSYVFISNHASNLDPLAVARAIPQTLRFVGKRSLARIPVFGWACRLGRIIFIDRTDSEKAVETINKAVQDLRNGISAYFFAEGTRSVDGLLRPFKKGGVMLALKAHLPIVPITIVGGHRLLPKKSLHIKSGVMKVIVGDPIDVRGYSEADKDLLLERVRKVITANLERYEATFGRG